MAEIVDGPVHGRVRAGFEDVARAFAANFERHGEVGAAFAAFRGREPLVDVWGGVADQASGRAWEEDTLQVIFSGTKGLAAVCMLMLLERGLLELDRPVAAYWPEFGKPDVRVADVMGHTARLPGIDAVTLSMDDIADDARMAEILAAQAQLDDPRAARCYHPLTYGWLCGELVRRVDGRSVGTFFREEVAEPFGLEAWIGLPADEERRVSTLAVAADWGTSPYLDPAVHAADPLTRAIWGNPAFVGRAAFPWNSRTFHAAEIPGAGGIATARAMARFYALLVAGDGEERLLAPETLQLARRTLAEPLDEVMNMQFRFGVGFGLQPAEPVYGLPSDAFGMGGAGGSLHGAWPGHGVGFSYAMNLMTDDQELDPRPQGILSALHACLAAGRS